MRRTFLSVLGRSNDLWHMMHAWRLGGALALLVPSSSCSCSLELGLDERRGSSAVGASGMAGTTGRGRGWGRDWGGASGLKGWPWVGWGGCWWYRAFWSGRTAMKGSG